MDFNWALEHVMSGKIAEHNVSGRHRVEIMFLESNVLYISDESRLYTRARVRKIDIEAINWRPHEEHFDLSKKVDRLGSMSNHYYTEEVVQEFIRQLKNHIEEDMENGGTCLISTQFGRISQHIDELAGERFKQ